MTKAAPAAILATLVLILTLVSQNDARASEAFDAHSRTQAQTKLAGVATPCTGGVVAGLPCNNVDLISFVPFADISSNPSDANDVWGFVDLNTGREYVLAGFNNGTAVVDITDPVNPREVGFVAGQSEIWRDMKVYQYFDAAADRWQAYAYVTTDTSTPPTDGLVIIDLTDLPHSISRVSYTSDINRAHNVYLTHSDNGTGTSLSSSTPLLIIVGSNIGNGRFRAYSLADPESPSFVNSPSSANGIHDAASMVITDARNGTQCGNGGSFCEVLFDFDNNDFQIWDITDINSPVRLSTTTFANVGFIHSGWATEDKQFLFVNDELDELNAGLNTTIRVFSIADLTLPTLAGTWTGPTGAIDHNGFVRGNRYYLSNYSRGLTILDITDPTVPVPEFRRK